MITIDTLRATTGTLYLRVVDISGVELWHQSGHNMIVSGGRNAITEALAGLDGAHIKSVAVGDNETPPTEADTEITNAVTVEIQSVEFPVPGTVRFNFSIGYDVANGTNICEFGLITADGRLFSRKVRAVIEKTQHMSIVGQWDISLQ